jgi:hypothetical protein
MHFLLYSKTIRYLLHAFVVLFLVWFIFPNLFTYRDIPRWPVLANWTAEGVDRNANNLRDDVEIRIHRKVGNDEDYLKIIGFAAAVERRIHYKVNTRSEGLAHFRNESCNNPGSDVFERNNLSEEKIVQMVLNTKARIDKSNQNVMFVTGSGALSEYLCGSTYDLSDDFERYMIKPKN